MANVTESIEDYRENVESGELEDTASVAFSDAVYLWNGTRL